MSRAALTLLVGLALTGCGGENGTEPAEGGAVRYVRSGGLAPIVEDLRIEPSGRASLSLGYAPERRTTRFNVPLQQLAAIRAGLDAADFADLPEHAEIDCADCYQHVISYGGHTVDRAETSIPPELEPALDRLAEIVAANRPPGATIEPGA